MEMINRSTPPPQIHRRPDPPLHIPTRLLHRRPNLTAKRQVRRNSRSKRTTRPMRIPAFRKLGLENDDILPMTGMEDIDDEFSLVGVLRGVEF